MSGFLTGVLIGLGIVAYLAIGYLCAVDMARRMKRCFPTQRFDAGDAVVVIILAGLLFPIGYLPGRLVISTYEAHGSRRWYHRFLRIEP